MTPTRSALALPPSPLKQAASSERSRRRRRLLSVVAQQDEAAHVEDDGATEAEQEEGERGVELRVEPGFRQLFLSNPGLTDDCDTTRSVSASGAIVNCRDRRVAGCGYRPALR